MCGCDIYLYYQIRKGAWRKVKGMKDIESRKGFLEEVSAMISTGASEKVVCDYIDIVYKKGEISTRLYEICINMVLGNN